MSQISPSNSTWSASDGLNVARWIKDPLCAGAAILPFIPLMIIKSAMQAQDPEKRRTFNQICKNEFNKKTVVPVVKGCIKASGAVAVTLGAQLYLQQFFEYLWKNSRQNTQLDNTMNSAIIPTGVAILTAPGLIGFNGLTMKKGFFKSIKQITPAQYLATVIREMFFLASIQFSGLATKHIQNNWGENKTAKHTSNFVVGFLGAAFGHNADTYLTWLQKGTLLGAQASFRHSFAGILPRAFAVGGFNTLYQHTKSTANDQLNLYERKISAVKDKPQL